MTTDETGVSSNHLVSILAGMFVASFGLCLVASFDGIAISVNPVADRIKFVDIAHNMVGIAKAFGIVIAPGKEPKAIVMTCA